MTNQWVNSYKRIVFGDEAPTAATWGMANRSALVRVPMYSPGKSKSRRVEIRSIDSACNPYLAYSVLLAAGLKGIKEGYSLPDPAEDNISELTRRERLAMGYRDLPTDLEIALQEMERSELVADALGDHVRSSYAISGGSGMSSAARSPSGSCAPPWPISPVSFSHSRLGHSTDRATVRLGSSRPGYSTRPAHF